MTPADKFPPRELWRDLYDHQQHTYGVYQAASLAGGTQAGPTLDVLRQEYVAEDVESASVERNVGLVFQDDPGRYAIDAIGAWDEEINEPWLIANGQLQVIRHLAGITDPNVILGPPVEESWLEYARRRAAASIGRLQIVRIMASNDPFETAEQFGQDILLEILDPPKKPVPYIIALAQAADNNPHSWFNQALDLHLETWPPSEVLALDFRRGVRATPQ